uniref:Uncharacterized protein n=1 Tax=Anopheles darlingi TaxID=43151 RepID=A0A2M4DPQ1_ANODA
MLEALVLHILHLHHQQWLLFAVLQQPSLGRFLNRRTIDRMVVVGITYLLVSKLVLSSSLFRVRFVYRDPDLRVKERIFYSHFFPRGRCIQIFIQLTDNFNAPVCRHHQP